MEIASYIEMRNITRLKSFSSESSLKTVGQGGLIDTCPVIYNDKVGRTSEVEIFLPQ